MKKLMFLGLLASFCVMQTQAADVPSAPARGSSTQAIGPWWTWFEAPKESQPISFDYREWQSKDGLKKAVFMTVTGEDGFERTIGVLKIKPINPANKDEWDIKALMESEKEKIKGGVSEEKLLVTTQKTKDLLEPKVSEVVEKGEAEEGSTTEEQPKVAEPMVTADTNLTVAEEALDTGKKEAIASASDEGLVGEDQFTQDQVPMIHRDEGTVGKDQVGQGKSSDIVVNVGGHGAISPVIGGPGTAAPSATADDKTEVESWISRHSGGKI